MRIYTLRPSTLPVRAGIWRTVSTLPAVESEPEIDAGMTLV
jgi:hypothetical protein